MKLVREFLFLNKLYKIFMNYSDMWKKDTKKLNEIKREYNVEKKNHLLGNIK